MLTIRFTTHRVVACSLAAAAAALICAASTSADIIQINGDMANATEGIADFTGSIEYVSDALSESGILTVTLTNTSDPDNGGFISGFLLNVLSDDAAIGITLDDATHPFIGITNQSAPPFGGPFTAGAALGGDWTGGGNPNAGIAVGETGSFTFDVSATDAGSLSAISFISGGLEYNFVVRFRGFNDGGSDKVPAVVPAPASLALLALGGLIAPRRRRSHLNARR